MRIALTSFRRPQHIRLIGQASSKLFHSTFEGTEALLVHLHRLSTRRLLHLVFDLPNLAGNHPRVGHNSDDPRLAPGICSGAPWSDRGEHYWDAPPISKHAE